MHDLVPLVAMRVEGVTLAEYVQLIRADEQMANIAALRQHPCRACGVMIPRRMKGAGRQALVCRNSKCQNVWRQMKRRFIRYAKQLEARRGVR